MPTSYKVKVFSGDGTTFIRPLTLVFPDAKSNGNSSVSAGYNAGMDASALCSYINNNGQANAITTSGVSFFFGSGPAGAYRTLMGSYGFTSIIDCDNIFTSNFVPIRLVFANGSYIKVTPTVDSSKNINLSLEYHMSNDALVGTLTQSAGRAFSATPTSGNYYFGWKSIPFPLYDIHAGAIVDWRARCYEAQGLFNDSSLSYFISVTTNFGNLGMPYSGSAPLNLENWYRGIKPSDTDNPYEGAGTSDEGGGDPDNQNFDDASDSVEEDAMPELSSVGTGMATIFKPTKSQLKYLADVFWGSQWWTALQNTVEGIDKMFVSLGIVPFMVRPGATVEVTWLGLAFTEIFLTLAAQQYYEFDMGSIDLANDSRIYTSDSAMDYSPFH